MRYSTLTKEKIIKIDEVFAYLIVIELWLTDILIKEKVHLLSSVDLAEVW